MNKITLRPLLTFINKLDRRYLTLGDCRQFINSINNRRARKIAAGQRVKAETVYLSAMDAAGVAFVGRTQVSKTKIINLVHNYLINGNYHYEKHLHAARCRGNAFYSYLNPVPDAHVYDLAFYNTWAGQNHSAHHIAGNKSSIFYLRCEEQGAQIMFGNMQIDARDPDKWDIPAIGALFLKKRNIYGMMVQQAIKHAIERKKTEILFQCGDANEYSQWGMRRLIPVKVSKRNYEKFQTNYQEKIARFGPRGCRVGDYFAPEKNTYIFHYVTEVGPDYYQVYINYRHPLSLFSTLGTPASRGPGEFPNHNSNKLSELLSELERKMFTGYATGDYAQFLTTIKNSLRILVPAKLPKSHGAKQLDQLRSAFPRGLDFYAFYPRLDQVWHAFNYDKLLLPYFPAIKKLVLTTPCSARPRVSAVYYNSADERFNCRFERKNYQPPELGQAYVTPARDRFNINFANSPGESYAAHNRMYNWYEKTLKQEIEKYGLTVEKIPITTIKRKRPVTAHAWKIISGINEFKRRPLVMF